MTSIFSSEPVIAPEKMLTETFTQVKLQQKKSRANNTKKYTDQGMPMLIAFYFIYYILYSFGRRVNSTPSQGRIQFKNSTLQ